MFTHILNYSNYLSFNIQLAHIIGLNPAIYCAELINIYCKAQKKNKLIDADYFKVDRKYIFNQTTLSIEDQLKIDANLIKINVLSKHQDDPDVIKIDIQLVASIIESNDSMLLEDIGAKVKIKSPKGTRETARQRIKNELKNSIQCSNYELLTALRD